MSMVMSQYTKVPYGELRMYQNFMLLSELGVLGRLKRYSKVIHINMDPNIGKSSNKPDVLGLEWERPVTTFSEAYALVTDGAGDVIIVDNSSYYDSTTYTPTYLTETDVAVAKADLTIVGMGDPMMDGGFKPGSASAGDGAALVLSAVAKNVMFKNLRFDTTTGLQGAIKTAASADFLTIDGCVFVVVGAAGPKGFGLNMAGVAKVPKVINSRFLCGTLGSAAIKINAGVGGALVEDCKISNLLNASGTGCDDGILVAAGTGVVINRVDISGGDTGGAGDAIVDGIDIDAGVINCAISNCTIGNYETAGVTDGGTDTSGATAGEGWVDTTQA